MELFSEVLGQTHPDTLMSLNDLGTLYLHQRRYSDAEDLLKRGLRASREGLGDVHPLSLMLLDNLATVYHQQGRYGDANQLREMAFALYRKVLGETHPDTLISLSNLAGLYASQGHYGEAQPLYEQAIQLSRDVLGPAHPLTLQIQLNSVVTLVNLDQSAGAARRLRQLEPQLLNWLGAELYSDRERRRSARPGRFAEHLPGRRTVTGGRHPEPARLRRWRRRRCCGSRVCKAEEEAWLARLIRRGEDPRIRDLAGEIKGLRAQLAQVYHGGAEKGEVAALTQELESKELALGRLSRDYEQHSRCATPTSTTCAAR